MRSERAECMSCYMHTARLGLARGQSIEVYFPTRMDSATGEVSECSGVRK